MTNIAASYIELIIVILINKKLATYSYDGILLILKAVNVNVVAHVHAYAFSIWPYSTCVYMCVIFWPPQQARSSTSHVHVQQQLQ